MVTLRERVAEHIAQLAWGTASLATGVGIVATASRAAASDLRRDVLTAEIAGGVAHATGAAPPPSPASLARASALAPTAMHASHVELVRPGRDFGLEVSMGSALIALAALSLHRGAMAVTARAPASRGPEAGQRALFAWGGTACLAGARLLFFLGHGIDPGDLRQHNFGYGAVNGVLDAAGLLAVGVGGATVFAVAVGRNLMSPPSLAANRVAALLSSGAGLVWAGAMEMIAQPRHDPLSFHAWGPPMLLGAGALAMAVGVGVGILGAAPKAPSGRVKVVIEEV